MQKEQIRCIISHEAKTEGLTQTGIKGVSLFRATKAIACVPAIYEPSIIAIVSGKKEAILDGHRHVYDESRYLCCPVTMPVKAGTPAASPENPLYGVLISLDSRIMAEIILEMEAFENARTKSSSQSPHHGIKLARWGPDFTEALLRLLQLSANETDRVVLGETRLRELYYAILKGEAGNFTRRAFAADNAIARSIAHMSAHLHEPVTIDEMANLAGMSRAVFHRKFKQVTTMAPIQFVKSMRLNNAAMSIASGMTVHQAALNVGYTSPSQFSREFKRIYGQSPRQWSEAMVQPVETQ